MARVYSKFLTESRRLNVALLPRAVYRALVNEYRRQEHVFEEVFEEQFWLWDLEVAAQQAALDGLNVSRADLAQQVMNGMEDNDWWKCMSAMEEHLIAHFHECPDRWAHLIDPVYDEHEQTGWPTGA